MVTSITRKYDNKNLWLMGGEKAFSNTNYRGPCSGEIWLDGNVRIKGSARVKGKKGRPGTIRRTHHKVIIAGPFDKSKIRLGALYCDCAEFQEILKKHGYTGGQYSCPDIAALQ